MQTDRHTARQTDICFTIRGAGPPVQSKDGLSRNQEGKRTGLEQRESTDRARVRAWNKGSLQTGLGLGPGTEGVYRQG